MDELIAQWRFRTALVGLTDTEAHHVANVFGWPVMWVYHWMHGKRRPQRLIANAVAHELAQYRKRLHHG